MAALRLSRQRVFGLAILSLPAFVPGPMVAVAPPVPSIAQRIRQLGSDHFAEREAATRILDQIGAPALAALRRAARSPDLEVRTRSAALVIRIQGRLDRTDVPAQGPPKGAVVLFGGKDLEGWVVKDGKSEPPWKVLSGGLMEARGVDIRTRKTFSGRFRLHLEFRVPLMPGARGQGRGNSGVYVQGRYEVQILDSFELPPNATSCGSVYGLIAPKVNACKAPATWQSFDIDFTSAVFKEGKKLANARLTLLHNGVKVHDDVEIPSPTAAGLPGDLSLPGPILLQGDRTAVQFRNVWLLPLPARAGR